MGMPACSDPIAWMPTDSRPLSLDDLPNDVCEAPAAGTRETGAVTPSPETRASSAAAAAAQLRSMTAAQEGALAGSLPATTIHPAGAPVVIRYGETNCDAWEVTGDRAYEGMRTGDMHVHGDRRTPYRVLQQNDRTFLINDAQPHAPMILRAADHGRELRITERDV